jgi:DNA helicase-2/ATP-dependent DNA helicase PcrA|tara:strand:- start:1992 stop:4388 length:2397 start_codon:yes stop_codon:yes gene_type:complete
LAHFLDQLNDAQRIAAEQTEGPVMVIAGAGSGKTRVLTFRIAYLLEKGVDAFNILSLTFTNKAAREMKSRIGNLVGDTEAKNLWMGTFHSVFARILRSEAEKLGYPTNFTIYDADDSKKVVANIIKEKQLDKDIYKTKSVASRISSLKNNLITPKAYFQNGELQAQDSAAKMPMFGEIYQAYAERCFRAGCMDFDDLLLKTNELMYRFPEVLAKYQNRFKYILVDEYQDTNHSQYLIVKALAAKFENICIVGDDAQSIYAFRGANIRNILNFQKDYPSTKLFKLEQNYRSSDNIVQAANSIIAKNKDQIQKNVWTKNSSGEKIIIHKSISDSDEGNYVATNVWQTSMNEGAKHDDFCILYRTNAQSRSFEDALRKKNIPYKIYGGLSFYQRKEIKDVLSYLRLVVNPKDEEAFRRVINYPTRGIGATTLAKLTIAAEREACSLWETCEKLQTIESGLNNATIRKITDFTILVNSFAVIAKQQDAFDLVAHVAKTVGLIKVLGEDKTPEGVTRYENVQELLNGIKDFTEQQKEIVDGDPTLAGFLADVALLTDRDNEVDDGTPKVSMMTIHLAKGLEFPYVYIVGLEENLFPSMMSSGSRSELEEERRLFYVALTRAEKRAHITYAHTRYRWGKLIDCEPSRFIDEIDDKFVDIQVPDFSPMSFSSEALNSAFGSSYGGGSQKGQTVYQGTNKNWGKNHGSNQGAKKKNTGPGEIAVPKPSIRGKVLTPVNKAGASFEASGDNLSIDQMSEGMRVVHGRFGLGVIKSLEGEGADAKAIIEFDNAGEKRLLLKFAKVRAV